MKQKHQVLTPQGREMLLAELNHLRDVRRPAVIERLRRQREEGAGQSTGDFQEVKEEGAFVEGRIRELETLLAEAEVAQSGQDGAVSLGSWVLVEDEEGIKDKYLIVGPAEVDSRAHRISHESPVGQALLGHRAGETVEAETPAGNLRLRILSVASEEPHA